MLVIEPTDMLDHTRDPCLHATLCHKLNKLNRQRLTSIRCTSATRSWADLRMACAAEASWKLRRGPSRAPAYGDALQHSLLSATAASAKIRFAGVSGSLLSCSAVTDTQLNCARRTCW